jgi:hypothetical protein
MRYKITAIHPGFGQLEFIVEADDQKQAFGKFKQIVGAPRQFTIAANEELNDADISGI